MLQQKFSWTHQNTAMAVDMWKNGYSASSISAAVGASRAAVLGFMHRNRELFPKKTKGKTDTLILIAVSTPAKWGKRAKWTDERLREASDMWKNLVPVGTIAEAMGVSIPAMKDTARRYEGLFPARDLHAINIEKAANRPLYMHAGKSIPGIEPVAFIDITSQHCKWILSDLHTQDGPDSQCCGATRLRGTPYCSAHAALSKGTGTRSERMASAEDNIRTWR